MGYQSDGWAPAEAWALARRQFGVVSRHQLIQLGMTPRAIKHRLAVGRLHRVHRGVYAVGRPELSRRGALLAAVLAAGRGATLSDASAAELWGIRHGSAGWIHVSARTKHAVPGIRMHERRYAGSDVTACEGVPITTPARTLVDIANHLTRSSWSAR